MSIVGLAGVFDIVVGILSCHLPQGRVALYADKLFKRQHPRGHRAACDATHRGHGLCIDLEHRLVGVLQPPHQHHADQDGIADLVIDLDGLGIEVARA